MMPFGSHQKLLGTTIPYISWLRKLPILPNKIPSGAILKIISNIHKKSFFDRDFLFHRRRIADTTPIIHPINDMPHCRIAIMLVGFLMKYARSYIITYPNLHQIITPRMMIMSRLSISCVMACCMLGYDWNILLFPIAYTTT